ncbi:hypothetical protein DRA4_0752 [Lactococcus lactis subsp. lactis bv. diacetylactis]|nr:hypothetical protein LLCRE1631_01737 [Lactococcus lactis subsp. lactis CNCM I-1631]KST91980.1 hypothetical protein KF134_1036 [Lactococcus lactis subsp. lactis]KZK13049.1 hypothetical protein DRA4_0752 [Lactococcus lactis subsp. lactis bv. diacetylactis]KST94996.1 hypothetical protein LKF24_1191 [Lactococcus lactis subsp. lactis]KSU28789.1 hypothetical protein NCDO895_0976 [Lactococcus lactis subsp. lactis]
MKTLEISTLEISALGLINFTDRRLKLITNGLVSRNWRRL